MTQTFTLAEVENYDARPAQAGRDEYRYLCCLSDVCRAKPRDAAHRSLCVNKQTGAFFCYRCGTKGKLKEFWQEKNASEKPFFGKREKARLILQSKFLSPEIKAAKTEQSPEKLSQMRENLATWQSAFADSPAEKYLVGRGISPDAMRAAGCGFGAAWEHWEKQADK